jgi:UDP-N-acetylglucosamine acyltransferase
LACIEFGAQLGEDVVIGPFCHIGAHVVLGDYTEIMSHAVVIGSTRIGKNSRIYPGAILGGDPQNKKHKGHRTTLEIGENCIIREGVTMHCGSDTSLGRTLIGNDCMFLAYAHVAHDCIVGNHVTFSNNAMIGGHVKVGDYAVIGGGGAVHQFVRIGHHAFVGGLAALTCDLIPYGTAIGVHAWFGGLNLIGMKRFGIPRSEIQTMRCAVSMLFDRRRPIRERALEVLEVYSESDIVADVIAFVCDNRRRPLCTPKSR